ncbi:hypothetical protein DPMN_041573 [Dreissena polymorpha]|uniref:Uncharacterized protein n=1 Tax=Dreissena polymorpha TaxID=45954 RepID=A0A9D4CZK4_DREPO|nr:hypothetical protein DPMN_041573 [Dreissena polymorpha]
MRTQPFRNVLFTDPKARPQFTVDTNVIIGNNLNAVDGRKIVVERDVESNPASEKLWEHTSDIERKSKKFSHQKKQTMEHLKPIFPWSNVSV